MELIRGLHNLKSRHRGCVATIGNFDGVHLGHQAVLGQLSEQAAAMGLPTTVITFEPQPGEYFQGGEAPARLTRYREKVLAMRRFSVDRLFCLYFNRALARLSPEEFIDQVLVKGLGVRYLVVGDDFRFGQSRMGDFETLKQAGQQHGFPVVSMHTFSIGGERVSSTRVRLALEMGLLDQAEQLLGRPYRLCGRIVHGDKRGRQIGFPTINLYLHRDKLPVRGVFAVEVFGIEGEPVKGVANIGVRPTVGGTRALLEVHLFDFDQQVYGRYVQVELLHKLRDEQRFESFDALKHQIDIDAAQARAFFQMG